MVVDTEYFWSKTERDGEDSCWLWLGGSHKGYPRYGGRAAHRIAYELAVGPIPTGLEIDHLCKRPMCIRPDHLEPVTRIENIRRHYAGMTHCKRGHEFTPENTYRMAGRGSRTCRKCQAAAVARYQERKAAS